MNMSKLENGKIDGYTIAELDLVFEDSDGLTYEVYTSRINKKSYEIELHLDDARKWNTIESDEGVTE
jgi:hypothetical protein|tara:strand:+ start:377 stop:577 length:201 start_codon:yes stop_codon:yes gene_type:complete